MKAPVCSGWLWQRPQQGTGNDPCLTLSIYNPQISLWGFASQILQSVKLWLSRLVTRQHSCSLSSSELIISVLRSPECRIQNPPNMELSLQSTDFTLWAASGSIWFFYVGQFSLKWTLWFRLMDCFLCDQK